MTANHLTVWLGFDAREAAAYAVARDSIRSFDQHIPIHGVILPDLVMKGIYYRPTERRMGKMWDTISGAHMSTEFAISRFFVPELQKILSGSDYGNGWALFMDCDVLVRRNLYELRQLFDDSKAVMCVKHEHDPAEIVKMDGQVQTSYPRKNWSSVMAFNCDHPSNRALNLERVNNERGLWLHQMQWLDNAMIGELPPEWNWIPGVSAHHDDPAIVHFSEGGPWFPSFHHEPFADEWRAVLQRWAR